jgi:hypothetical protein
MAITGSGALWSWGTGNGGVLGRSSPLHTPEPVPTIAAVRSVVSGALYASALLASGEPTHGAGAATSARRSARPLWTIPFPPGSQA